MNMKNSFDIDNLKAIPIIEVAERLGIEVRGHKAHCVFHSPDRHPSLRFYENRGTAHCFTCGKHCSSTIDLVMQVRNCSFVEACKWLSEGDTSYTQGNTSYKYGNSHTSGESYKKTSEDTADLVHLARLINNPHLNDDARRFLFDERKISKEVAERMHLSSLSREVPMSGNINGGWFNAPSLLIPYFSVDGQLVNLQARYLGSEKKPRFQFPKGARTIIFNAPQLAQLAPGDHLCIAEGVSDCLAMLSAGYKAIAVPSATLLTYDDQRLISEAAARVDGKLEIDIWPDNDRAGSELANQIALLSTDIGVTLHQHKLPEGCKDFGEFFFKMKNEE